MANTIRFAVLLFALSFLPSPLLAVQPPVLTEVARIFGDQPTDQFGTSVAVDGNLGVVGALQGDGAVANSGTAYVLERNGAAWTRGARLEATDSQRFADFSRSVAVDGPRIVVGAPATQNSIFQLVGASYVFDRTNDVWRQSARLTALDAASLDNFGFAVSVLGDRALVGANKDDYAGLTDPGSAYVFDRSPNGAWQQSAKLTPTEPQFEAEFGSSTALAADRAVIGARHAGPIFRQGAVYVFDQVNGAWTQTTRLTAHDAALDYRFGSSIAMDGNRILVGAPLSDLAVGEAGAAYLFEWVNGTWTEVATFVEPDAQGRHDFGFAVALHGNRAVIGSPGTTVANGQRGAAYVFEFADGNWTAVNTLLASDTRPLDAFGEAVSIVDDWVMVGARLADTPNAMNVGATYVYLIPEPCTALLLVVGLVSVIGKFVRNRCVCFRRRLQ